MQSTTQNSGIAQSQEPIAIDEIVVGSVLQVENSLVAISAVSGLPVVLAKFRQPVKHIVAAPTSSAAKRKPGRPAGQPGKIASGESEVAQPMIQ